MTGNAEDRAHKAKADVKVMAMIAELDAKMVEAARLVAQAHLNAGLLRDALIAAVQSWVDANLPGTVAHRQELVAFLQQDSDQEPVH
jgi:hypothetical protein